MSMKNPLTPTAMRRQSNITIHDRGHVLRRTDRCYEYMLSYSDNLNDLDTERVNLSFFRIIELLLDPSRLDDR